MAQAIATPYGAFELKKLYQKNMIFGTVFTISLTIVILFSIWLYRTLTYEELVPTNVIRIKTIAELGAPPSLSAKPPQVSVDKPKVTAPKVGIPTPVADDEVEDEDIVIASREELQEINAPVFSSDAGDGTELLIDIPEEDYMPSPDEFIPYEEQPLQTYEEIPDYPRLAQEGGFTGYVIVQAYIDKNGSVKKAQSVKCNRPNMGFEEAAVKAAYKGRYRPAIQNGSPTGCWISYRVEFKLGNN
ncbi:MAG: TonB family protein [candidate division Zixibacteria bacterium]|nr:TonB family protein [candidate division Zixibacteria bacterium]